MTMHLLQSERSRVEHVYSYIVDYKTTHDGCSPSFRMIMRACGVSSTSMVSLALDALRRENRIRLVDDGRAIAVVGGRWTPPKPARANGCRVAGAEEVSE